MNAKAIVVIEDDPLLRLNAAEMFEAAGLYVVEFENGGQAIDYIRAHQDSVAGIFTDIKLPGDTDGLELASIVSEACPQIAVVVTSGKFSERPSDLPLRARYFVKPWLPLDVLNVMLDASQSEG